MSNIRMIAIIVVGMAGFTFVSPAIAQVTNVWSAAPITGAQMFQKGIGTDSEGNVYSVSGFRGAVDFGKGPITPPSGERGLTIAKYDPTGFLLGALGTAYSADTFIFDMAVDDAGNIYIAGYFEDTSIDLGGGAIPNVNGDSESFIVKYNAFGFYQWAHSFDTGSNPHFRHLAADDSGNVYLYGLQLSGLDFGGGALANGAFLVKFNTDGDHQWSQMLPASGISADIAVDHSQSVVVTDVFGGSIDLGGGTITGTGSGDFFVVKFGASNGAHEWSMGFASGSPEAITVDSGGAVSLSVTGSSTIDFGGGPLTNTSSRSVFVAKLNADGDHLWSRVSSTSATSLLTRAVAMNAFGEVYVAGSANAVIDLGGGDRSAPFGTFGSFMFLVKYDADGNHVWSQAYGGTESVFGSSLAIDNANRVFLGGGYMGATDLGTGPFPDVGSTPVSFVAGFFDTSVPIDPANCFIATAAYGSPMANEVNVFRNVRDRFLLKTGPGAAFVDFYYETSPPIAEYIEDHPRLRTLTRWALTPILYYSRALLAAPMVVSAGSLLCFAMMGYCSVRLYTRRRRRIRTA